MQAMTQAEIAKLFDGAPEGATHYSLGNPGNGECSAFWRAVNGKLVEFWGVLGPGNFRHLYNGLGYCKTPEECIARPAVSQWNGEGLPSVGTVCEVFNNDLSNPEWEKCTILFSGKHRIVYDSESCCERVGYIDCLKFRPIRTQEQIAADERESGIEALRRAISGHAALSQYQAAMLYDGGCRMPEGGAK